MKRLVVLAAVFACLSAAGCATAPEMAWQPRTDANLKTDLADCKKQADSVDFRSAEAFSDSKYGAAAAIASRTNEVDLTSSSLERMYAAVTYVCMTDKGWKPAS